MPDEAAGVTRPLVYELHEELDDAVRASKEIMRRHHAGPVTAVAFSADGRLLATASQDNTARLFEAASGKELARLAHDSWVNAVAFSTDGAAIITASGVE